MRHGLRQLARVGFKTYVAASVRPESTVRIVGDVGPFSCLLWDHVGCTSSTFKAKTASALIDLGCRYAVCGGREACAWELAFDNACIAKEHGAMPEDAEDALVMTTSHPRETQGEVAYFFVECVQLDARRFKYFIVTHVGGGKGRRRIDNAVRKQARTLALAVERPRARHTMDAR